MLRIVRMCLTYRCGLDLSRVTTGGADRTDGRIVSSDLFRMTDVIGAHVEAGDSVTVVQTVGIVFCDREVRSCASRHG